MLKGYQEEKSHDVNKIFEVLNSFYRILSEHNGVEPMPLEVFKELKDIIHEISQNMVKAVSECTESERKIDER